MSEEHNYIDISLYACKCDIFFRKLYYSLVCLQFKFKFLVPNILRQEYKN